MSIIPIIDVSINDRKSESFIMLVREIEIFLFNCPASFFQKLQVAGIVDKTGSIPFDKTMKMMNWAMDEIDKIMAKKGI
ncbi:MAG: hypothetical protein L6422_12305 [Candidatus Marinimicrobia bacterium]|nr:hypothetical protein [Candidatus Neomarinimicrobiota bacterium]